MHISCFNDLADCAKASEKKSRVAVVEAQDESTIKSVLSAAGDGIVHPILIGDGMKIRELIEKAGAFPMDFDIVSSNNAQESIKNAVDFIHAGEASVLMKGSIETSMFMKAVLHERNELLAGGRLSLAGIFETPSYHKLFAVSDMGVNTYPDFDCKRAIVENAVRMLNALGNARPKVAILSSIERLNPKLPDTVDADALKRLSESGKIKNCIVEGPISFDLATSSESAKIKGYTSPVAGDADLLIVPDLAVGNILAKCLTGFAGAQTAGTVLGAKVPIILTSRSAAADDKYASIALAACLGNS
ncbi:MAG: bifunctional enoyl-CoA hydratase/phosphate acetyltransferase [Oscillospiraceae bacterium]|nr:bifunctional enoyl-CoA hydratase/phosphate acetyltransferase [Oscillospiraceae bacterium]